MQAFLLFFSRVRAKRESWSKAFLAETVETGDNNRAMHFLCRKLRKD